MGQTLHQVRRPNAAPRMKAATVVTNTIRRKTDPAAANALDGYAEARGLDKMSIYLDCGDARDPFSAGAASLEQALTTRGIAVEFHPHDGGHNLRLDLLEHYLLFYAGK